MTAVELFNALGPMLGPALEAKLKRRDLCVLSTAIIRDVGAYFDIEIEPVPCRVVVYNAAFASHLVDGHWEGVDVRAQTDGSWSVGVGFGGELGQGKWDGHLIAAAGGWFLDCSIRQAERLNRGIVTGPYICGPIGAPRWRAENNAGTTVEYERTDNTSYRRGPDWRQESRRRRIVGALIRQIRAGASIL